MPPQHLADFAEAIVHELRTPLSVIAGEVDLALARDRSPAGYRDTLARIGECVAELVDLTGDVALYGASGEYSARAGHTSSVGAVFAALAERYGSRRGTPITLEGGLLHRRIADCDTLITGALSLLVEHAVKHRRSATRVQIRAVAPVDPAVAPGTIDFLLEAVPGGFPPAVWQALAADDSGGHRAHGALRLQTAAGIIRGCGGSVELTTAGGAERVLLRLRAAPPHSHAADEIL